MRFKNIVKLFENGSVCVVGLRGKGKDMLMANVACRRNLPYVSNINYGGHFHPFRYVDISCGGNTYKNFIDGNVKSYVCPYEDKTDIYLSDCGVYFPSQYCSELNREYKNIPIFVALSRHINLSALHWNCQNLNRVWDKLREMSETYILCRFCKVFGKIVIQRCTIYDKPDSCQQRVKPFAIRPPLFAKSEVKQQIKLEKQRYEQTYGSVRNVWLIYVNKSNYDTRIFKTILEGDKNEEKQ